MFRYPDLDCWQTMLKRLYKKELEQVVLWFEEYRIALYSELERQTLLAKQQQPQPHDGFVKNEMLDLEGLNLRKTDV